MEKMDVEKQNQRGYDGNSVQAPPGFQQAQQQQQRYMMPSFGPPEIDPSEIEFLQQIGNGKFYSFEGIPKFWYIGSFGAVWAGKCRQKDVAIKVLAKQDFDAKTLEAFRHEVEIMSKIFHPNVNLVSGEYLK
jgi:hypothetical protein